MNRRNFFGAVGLSGLAFFSRESQGQVERGLSHEQMAEVIVDHPYDVFLSGDTRFFGFCRYHYYAKHDQVQKDRVGKWCKASGDVINCDGSPDSLSRTKSVGGCMVKINAYHFGDLNNERLFDISNPLLKVIRLLDTPSRHFAHLGEKWVELRH